MAKADDRGSKLQHLIYQLTLQLYQTYEVVYEYPIGNLGQRIDIFIPLLGIALEIDGIQHFKFVKFFFKDEAAWNSAKRLDEQKENYLVEHGVKLVRIPYDTKIKTVEELKELIDNVEYPDVEYTEISTVHEYRDHVKKEFRQKTKDLLKEKYKESNQKAYNDFKEKRKENYKLQKERQRALEKKKKAERKGNRFLADDLGVD